jgi:RNA polymerase sigma-70 factor (ECF subfamily)
VLGDEERPSKDARAGLAAAPAGSRSALPRETLVRVREREPQALADFFDYGFDRIFSLAARLMGDRAAAEDVVQEVFLKVHRAADRLDPDRDPLPWLTAITINVCRDHWRSPEERVAARTLSLDSAGGALVADGRDPEAEALGGERDRLVQEAIMRLPEELRAVVILHDYHGMGHAEIADAVGASHAAVRKRYSRALAKLADDLKKRLG